MTPTMFGSFFERHRPQTFATIVGNHHPIRVVEGMFRRGLIHNGFALHGDNGEGKNTFALCLARSLVCQNRPESQLDACGRCESCSAFKEGLVWGRGVRVRNCADLTFEDVKADFADLLYAHGPVVFFYDEFQRCKWAIQDLLVTKLEEDRGFVLILSTPSPEQIKEKALRQRLVPLHLSSPSNQEMTDFLVGVCRKEHVTELEVPFISTLCRQHGNNPRECLNALYQFLCQTDRLTMAEFDRLGSEVHRK